MKKKVTLLVDQKKILIHQYKTAERKVSVILEYAGRNASSRKPEILVSLCTTLLWNMVYYSDHSY